MNNLIRIGAAAVGLLFAAALVLSLTIGRGGLGHGDGLGSGSPAGGSTLADIGPAPEFTGIVGWENSAPLTMASLRGKVVLIDFWTYSCINCQRTIPFVRQWWDRYKDAGLVIVGVHSPEFDFEKNPGNIRRAIHDDGVTWPVAVDSNMATWNAWQNQYWPAEYLVDQKGRVRHTHFGEGEYDVTEQAIRQLLSETGETLPGGLASADPGIGPDSARETAETYAGSNRGDGSIRLSGAWALRPEYAEHTASAAPGADWAEIPYQARRVFLVAGSGSGGPVRLRITLDGRDLAKAEAPAGVQFDAQGHAFVVVDHNALYPLVASDAFAGHALRISPDAAGFQLYTFTFGS